MEEKFENGIKQALELIWGFDIEETEIRIEGTKMDSSGAENGGWV